jgi:YidC/Oxa1 family membrane protein insertase
MKLYKETGANPIGGCLPILVTIPIFYALYKTLYVTLDMRHEPFWYMKDLSAPDPTAFGNLFGLLSFWDAADIKAIPVIGIIIGIGILPILYGATMAVLQSLSPPPPDKMQARIIMALPLVFMFVFGGFAAGLVLYWVWSNVLTFIQQYWIMRANGAETEVGKFVAKYLGQRKAPAK